jgi:CheY-like chemotaxis protein
MSDNNLSKTILFADDDWFVDPFVSELQDAGYHVLQTTTGADTLEAISKNKIDLIILDIMMPPGNGLIDPSAGKRTGIRVAEIVRKEWKLSLPIIYVTVISDDAVLGILEMIEREALQDPRIYVKPVNLEDLLAEVESCLGLIQSS